MEEPSIAATVAKKNKEKKKKAQPPKGKAAAERKKSGKRAKKPIAADDAPTGVAEGGVKKALTRKQVLQNGFRRIKSYMHYLQTSKGAKHVYFRPGTANRMVADAARSLADSLGEKLAPRFSKEQCVPQLLTLIAAKYTVDFLRECNHENGNSRPRRKILQPAQQLRVLKAMQRRGDMPRTISLPYTRMPKGAEQDGADA